MAVIPTYSTRPTFLGTANEDPDADFVCAGVPFDIGTTHRAGARFGPMAIRAISRMLVDGVNPMNWHDVQSVQLADIVDFDAHVDTWPDSFGQVYGHGAVFYHAIEEGLVDPNRMIQIGIRSPVGRDIWDWTIGKGVSIWSAQEVHRLGPDEVVGAIHAKVGKGKTYLSFDIDAID